MLLSGCRSASHAPQALATHDGVASVPVTSQAPGDDQRLPGVIEFHRQTLTFKPTRDDLTVGCAVFTLNASHPYRVNGKEVTDSVCGVHLKQVATNQFELPALKIEYSASAPDAILCMSVKIWFNEVSNFGDSSLYEHTDDRYALLAWCSGPGRRHRFDENRVATLDEFRQALSKPFVIRLNNHPIPADGRYPILNNSNVKLSDADLQAVRKVMQDRGERYPIYLGGAVDQDHAKVTVSVGDATRFQGTRVYQLVRKDGTWQVESVVDHPNMSSSVVW
jgi:hypothetical protein